MAIPDRLIELVTQRRVVPFVGAGFSMPSGLPSWSALVKGLISASGVTALASASELDRQLGQADVAELLDVLSPTEFAATEYLVEQIGSYRYEPSQYHALLVELGSDVIVTTNWDVLIETQLAANKLPCHVLSNDTHVAQYDADRAIQLLKLHGTITDPQSLVYRRSQYEGFWEKRPLLLNLLLTLMSTRSCFFLGYGFGDPNILALLQILKERLGRLRREHYVLVHGTSPLDGTWNQLGVRRIDAFEFADAGASREEGTRAFLHALSRATRPVSLTNLERARLVNREIEKVTRRMPPKAVLRMRGALGWLSNPVPVPGDTIYGSDEQDREERRMTEHVIRFLERSPAYTVKCILHIAVEPLLRSGYRSRHIKRRLETVRDLLGRFGNQIRIVHDPSPSYLNQMIFDDSASVFGHKSSHLVGINRTVLRTSGAALRAEVTQFDAEFDEISAMNRGAAVLLGVDVAHGDWQAEFIRRLLDDAAASVAAIDDIAVVTGTPDTFWPEIRLVAMATEEALARHRACGQTREDGVTPYGVHIVRVLERLRRVGLIHNSDTLAAAALHDVVEDCGVSLRDLADRFGARVATVVGELTSGATQPAEEYVLQLKAASMEAKAIKLADRWDNVDDLRVFMSATFGGMAPMDYLNESRAILDVCGGANVRLAEALARAIDDCRLAYQPNASAPGAPSA